MIVDFVNQYGDEVSGDSQARRPGFFDGLAAVVAGSSDIVEAIIVKYPETPSATIHAVTYTVTAVSA